VQYIDGKASYFIINLSTNVSEGGKNFHVHFLLSRYHNCLRPVIAVQDA